MATDNIARGLAVSQSVFNGQAASAGVIQPNVYNATQANLANWQRAKARVTSKTGRGRALVIGTSKTAGAGAGTGAQLMDGASAKAWPELVAGILNASGLPASRDSWCGSKGMATMALVESYYQRVTIATKTNWSGTGSGFIGGVGLINGTDTTKLVFAPTAQTDTYEMFHAKLTGATNTLAVGVNGGAALATPSGNAGANAVGKATITTTLGQNTWDMWRTAGSGVFAGGIAFNSAVPAVDIINGGLYGARTIDNVGGSYTADVAIAVWQPDLTIIGLQTNDIGTGVSVADFATRMRTLATAAKAAGDCILLIESFTALGGNTTLARQQAYRQAMLDLAVELGCVVLDFSGLMVDYVTANARGYFADTQHESALGYGAEANAAARLLLAA